IHRVHWAGGSAGPATINPPVCDSSFHCVSSFSFGQGAPTHGDLVGTFVVAGGGSLVGSTIQISSVETFNGTVSGCGTGTVLIRSDTHTNADFSGGGGTWSVVPGSGTGDLTNLVGGGTGDFTGAEPTEDGVVIC